MKKSPRDEPFRLYRELEDGEQMCIFGDPAEGQDYCAAVAVSKRHGDFPFVYSRKVGSSQFGYDLHKMAKYINHRTNIWPTIAVERNVGAATIFVLQELHYPNLYRMDIFDSSTNKKSSKIGWLMTKSTRRKMLDDFAMAVRQGQAHVYDLETIEQMLSFVFKDGKPQAESGKNDDLVISCYSNDTQVLTKNGWKLIQNVMPGEMIPSLNLETGEVEVVQNLETIDEKYEGEMVHFNTRGVDLVVTPNHKMVIRDSLGANEYGALKLERADKLIGDHFRLTKGGKWSGIKKEEWVISGVDGSHLAIGEKFRGKVDPLKQYTIKEIVEQFGVGKRCLYRYLKDGIIKGGKEKRMWKIKGQDLLDASVVNPQIKRAPMRFKTSDFLSLLGFYLAEGWVRNSKSDGGRVGFAQRKKSKGYLPFKSLLENMGLKYSYRRGAFTIYDSQLARHILDLAPGKSYEKRIPRFILNLHPSHLEHLYKFMMLGDGSNSRIYVTTSKGLKDDFIELVAKLGMYATYKERLPMVGGGIKGRTISGNRKTYFISIGKKQISPRVNHHSKNQAKKINYKGQVTCLRLEKNHTIYVERKGKTCWSGNTAGAHQLNLLVPYFGDDDLDYISKLEDEREKWRFK
jgi:ribonucleoside-triphosphate reductase (formate)